MPRRSTLELLFEQHITDAGLPCPKTSYTFAKETLGRNWEADFAWPDLMLLCEIEGGVHIGGRHTRGVGFINDCEKYAEAQILGWRVMRLPGPWVEDGTAIIYLCRLIERLRECQETVTPT